MFFQFPVHFIHVLNFFWIADATTVPRFKDSPGKNVFTTVGKTIELNWTFEVNLTEYPDAAIQFLQPSNRLLYAIEIATNQTQPNVVLKGMPFLNRITWTGNVADNRASFTFSNVTHDLSLKYFLALYFSGRQHTDSVILHVLGKSILYLNNLLAGSVGTKDIPREKHRLSNLTFHLS